jgi:hypothetical protein
MNLSSPFEDKTLRLFPKAQGAQQVEDPAPTTHIAFAVRTAPADQEIKSGDPAPFVRICTTPLLKALALLSATPPVYYTSIGIAVRIALPDTGQQQQESKSCCWTEKHPASKRTRIKKQWRQRSSIAGKVHHLTQHLASEEGFITKKRKGIIYNPGRSYK